MDIASLRFDPQRAMQLAESIVGPRRVGTVGAAATGQQLAETLQSWGYQVEAEEFSFTDLQSRLLTLQILLSQALILLAIWLSLDNSSWVIFPAVLLAGLLLSSGFVLRRVLPASLYPPDGWQESHGARLLRWIGRDYHAVNYVARLPGFDPDSAGLHLTLLAHYDTKSQRLPLPLRIALFSLGIAGGLLFALLVLLAGLFPILEIPALLIGVSVLLAGVPLWFLDFGNQSPGAIDNASGVGVLLHLAELLARQPETYRRLDLTFLLTSAEELGTLGAVAYSHLHEAELREQASHGRSFVLNFDGVGVDGALRWVGGITLQAEKSQPGVYTLLQQVCGEQGIRLMRFNLPGAMYDHQPFAALGVEAGTLIATGRASSGVHTWRDTVEQLHPRGFQQAGCAALGLIIKLLR